MTTMTRQTVIETIMMTHANDGSGSSSSGVTACPATNRRQSQTTFIIADTTQNKQVSECLNRRKLCVKSTA